MKFAAFPIAFALSVAAPAAAQTGYNPNILIGDFNEATVAPVLAERKIEIIGRYTGQEKSFLDIKFADGMLGVANFSRKLPNADRRTNMTTLIVIYPRPDWSMQRKADFVINFNRENLLTQVGLYDTGQLYIQRYSLCDFGLPQGTLATELQILEMTTKKLKDELAKP